MAKKTKDLFRPLKDISKEEMIELMAQVIMVEGEKLGNDIIHRIELTEVDAVEIGIMAVGLAKAVAFAKDVAHLTGVNFDKLYRKELASYRRNYEKRRK